MQNSECMLLFLIAKEGIQVKIMSTFSVTYDQSIINETYKTGAIRIVSFSSTSTFIGSLLFFIILTQVSLNDLFFHNKFPQQKRKKY